MGNLRFSLSRSPEESLAIGTAVVAQRDIDLTERVSTNSKVGARDMELYQGLVTAISKHLGFRRWAENWTPRTTGGWPADSKVRIDKVQETLQKILWPGSLPELELSAIALGYIVAEAYVFSTEKPFSFAKIATPERWPSLYKESRGWNEACAKLTYEATAAANWFADVVRRDLVPDFFRKEGRFTVVSLTSPSLRGGVGLYEYDDENRPKDLEAVKKRVADIVAPYRALAKERESEEHA